MHNIANVAAAVLTCTALAGAQTSGGGLPTNHGPHAEGQWNGPFDLASAIDGTNQNPEVREITHAILIPPASPQDSETSPYAGQVMFLMDRANENNPPDPNNNTWIQTIVPTYVWSIDDPTNVTPVFLPPGGDAEHDVFCSGHASLGTGQPIVVGGLNRELGGGAGNEPYGHNWSYVLRSDLATPETINAPEGELIWEKTDSVARPRWYPTVMTLPQGDVISIGHGGMPNERVTKSMTDVFVVDPLNPLTGLWSAGIPNRLTETPCDNPLVEPNSEDNVAVDAFDEATQTVRHYPRLHTLISGDMIWADAATNAHQYSTFLTVDTSLPTDCDVTDSAYFDLYPNQSYDDYTWKTGEPSLHPIPGESSKFRHAGGNTAHFVTHTGTGNDPADYQDTIYIMGGTVVGQDDQPCPCDQFSTDGMKRIINPTPTTASQPGTEWQWAREDQVSPNDPAFDTYPASLNFPRTNHNAVILLDGSILVVGGADDDPTSTQMNCGPGNPAAEGCVHRRRPERFRPVEIFPNVTKTGWKNMQIQATKRQYHSVAGLLPDGRVFSAGGTYQVKQAGVALESDQQTVDIFSPTYFFNGARPKIRPDPIFSIEHSPGALIELTVSGRKVPKRVALLRPASVTHAFDSNQRYVEAPILGSPSLLAGETNVWSVFMSLPPTNNIVPPGWYLLTVVDDDNRPSEAKWLFIGVSS